MPASAPPFTAHETASRRTSVLAVGDAVGRFELRRVLGSGAQATVWLGFDPRLEREVAIKVMRPVGGDTAALAAWLREARHVARLAHPRIVGLYEADVHGAQPYLVFEYVAGQTLGEHLRAHGRMAPAAACALALDVLDAVAAAHAAGVVHRDLKPGNVMVDAAGRARVMDFGMAEPARDGQAAAAVPGGGTPAYMAPEAAAGAPASPQEDVFSAGLVLAEMLLGRPLVAEADSYRAIYRIAHEDLALPADCGQPVDDALRALVQRAVARDPQARHAGAQALRDAVAAWLRPDAAPGAGDAVASSGTLDFLLRRMRHKTDFPAMSDSVVRIQRMAGSDNESAGALTDEILKDVALTNKLLRLVNSVNFTHANRGAISTVSRAVSLVGFNTVRSMALSLVLLEHMQDKAHAGQMKEEFLRAMMAGSIAGELSAGQRGSEEAFISAMFQNLGRMLCEFYFPEEAQAVRGQLAGPQRPEGGEEQAARNVLGIGFGDLGVGVAQSWGLPDELQQSMRRPEGPPPARPPVGGPERMQWAGRAANDIATTLLWSEPGERLLRLRDAAERYAGAVGLAARQIEQTVAAAQGKLQTLAGILNIQVQRGSAGDRLLNAPPGDAPAQASAGGALIQSHALRAAQAAPLAPVASGGVPTVQQSTDMLAAGIQDITNAMVENFQLNDVLRMILETMVRALGLHRVVFCLRDARTDTLTGRFGLGADAAEVARAIRVPLKGADLVAVVCARGADTLIADSTDPRIAERLPAWFRSAVRAPSFLLLPMQMNKQPFALIYADQATPGTLVLDDKQLALLRTLRNQAVMAFKQAG